MFTFKNTVVILAATCSMALAQQDATSALQAKINAAPATNGVVNLTPGTYNYTAVSISGKTNLTINGNGKVTLEELADQGAALAVVNSPGLTISGVTFNHSSHNGYILDITSNKVTINGCTFLNLGDGTTPAIEVGIYIAPESDDVLIENNTFKNFKTAETSAVRGVYVTNYRNTSLASQRTTITKNQFEEFTGGVDQDGVVIDQQGLSSYSVVSNNTFTNVMKRGVKVMTNNTTVQGNTVTMNGLGTQSRSVVAIYGDTSTVENNHGIASGCNSGCSFYAAYDLGGSDILLQNNDVTNPATTTDNPHNCILIDIGETTNGDTSFDGISIVGNTCRNYSFAKIAPNTPLTNFTATDNTFIGSTSGTGFEFYPGATVSGFTLYGNTIAAGDSIVSYASGN
jgi:hypothetical protein